MITHNNPEAQEGSAAVAVGVGNLIYLRNKGSFLDAIVHSIRMGAVKQNLSNVRGMQYMSLKGVLKTLGPTGRVTNTVPVAVACFLWTHSFKDAVMAAVAAGGDADTTAAITGAFAGAYYGYGGIPHDWKEGLEDEAHIRGTELTIWNRR